MLQTPVTCAPRAFAICTAKVPTPPLAPVTSARFPAASPASRQPWSAVHPAVGSVAACTAEIPAGRRTSWPAGTRTSSANAPVHQPNTSSPGATSSTSGADGLDAACYVEPGHGLPSDADRRRRDA